MLICCGSALWFVGLWQQGPFSPALPAHLVVVSAQALKAHPQTQSNRGASWAEACPTKPIDHLPGRFPQAHCCECVT